MPNCFQLLSKETGEPQEFAKIDDEMRQHFGAEPDDRNYFRSWFDIEGLALAWGHDWASMKEVLPNRIEIIEYLEERYDSRAWVEIGRR